VAVVQHTFTYKRYTEQHNQQLWLESFLGFESRVVKQIGKSAGRAPSL